ncbi:MAG: hypothetical protein Q9183_005236, partial [Haloplaca sp. 2 TL-2023]
NPPATYQQPAVDLLAGLGAIQEAVDRGVYKNEYDFEAAVQKLVYSAHDGHLNLYAGILSVFTFGAPVSIVSVSDDGVAFPKIFVLGKSRWKSHLSAALTVPDDLLESGDPSKGAQWKPSAISTINGLNTAAFLKSFAALNSPGTLESNADWNQLMSSPAYDVQGFYSIFEGATPFWPGNEITFVFENGTEPLTLPWLATYFVPDDTPKITSGNDLYRFFVLGLYPEVDTAAATASFPTNIPEPFAPASNFTNATSTATPVVDPSAAASASVVVADSDPPEATSWEYFPYPQNPVTVQPSLGDGGVITGYFLNDDTTAVLSIPSFSINSEAIVSFSTTVGDFLQKSRDAGKERIIIDLQRNGGDGDLLATDTFKQVCHCP